MKTTLLDDRQIETLHRASVEILETIGVHLPHETALELFREAGAQVDREKQIVKISEPLLSRCLQAAGKRFTIYGRERSKKAEFGEGKHNYNSTAGQAHWVEDSLERRRTTLDDVRAAVRLGDALRWINIVGAMADPHELPVEYRCLVVAAELLKNTTKPITLWFPQLLDRQFFETWAAEGKQDMLTRCMARKEQILQAHTPTPINEDTRKAVDQLLKDAQTHLGK